jgi:hypothetical protein
MDCPDNQQIVQDMEAFYQDVVMTIPEEEMDAVKIEISVEQLCCICELLMAMLATYEGYIQWDVVDTDDNLLDVVH